MPLQREVAIKYIGEKLAQIQAMVYMVNGQQLYDINHILEDFCTGLLNRIYGWNLININHERKNSPAIDLGDINNAVAIQITSDNSGSKVKDTISKFSAHGCYEKYTRLIIVLLSPRKSSYSVKVNTNGKFDFSLNRDIKDFRDLFCDISQMDIDGIISIQKYIEAEFPDEFRQFDLSLYDKMTSAINLLSSGKIREVALDVELLFGADVNAQYLKLLKLLDLQTCRKEFMELYDSELTLILSDEPEKKKEYETLVVNSEQFDYYEPLYSFCDSYIIRVKIPYDQTRDEFINYRIEHTEYLERAKQIETAEKLCVDAAKNELKQILGMQKNC